MIVINCVQGSEEWHLARCGIPTASEFHTAVGVYQKKTGDHSAGDPNEASRAYAAEIAIECISEKPYGDTFQTFAMKRGSEQEMWARARYEEKYNCEVDESGLVLTDDRMFGYSTDGFVGDKGMIEIKTPLSVVKIMAMIESGNTAEYDHQIQGGLWITGREWCDFIMYIPALEKIGNDLYVKRIYRNEDFIDDMAMKLWGFVGRVKKIEAMLRRPFVSLVEDAAAAMAGDFDTPLQETAAVQQKDEPMKIFKADAEGDSVYIEAVNEESAKTRLADMMGAMPGIAIAWTEVPVLPEGEVLL